METIATKTASCFENLYAFLYDIEKVMRERNLEAYCTEIDVVLVSFSLSNGRFLHLSVVCMMKVVQNLQPLPEIASMSL